ncbi:recombinase family protein, partial [Actinomadura adrarensis]
GPVVQTIFRLRIGETLGYQAIADRLNLDLDRYPPPEPINPSRAVGKWTHSSVRDILVNPKYTGYMVWNRRATTSAGGRNNPPEEWVWSSRPTHEPLVSIEDFTIAQQVGRRREGSRSRPGPNTACPDARRAYVLRSYLTCAVCDRRMFGKDSRGRVYYVCSPKRAYVPEGHPPSIWIREEPLIKGLSDFFAREIFGSGRRERLQVMLGQVDDTEIQAHQESIKGLERSLQDLQRRQERLLYSLEIMDDPDPLVVRDVNLRAGQLAVQRES